MAINNAVEIRREIIARFARLIVKNELIDKIDRLPLEMRPKNRGTNIRCCIHKERAVIKYKTMALMGFNVYDETDELDPLSHYARLALNRENKTPVMMTVVDEACSSCVKSNYIVTNLCRACVARPCTYACKKGAIKVGEKQAQIDHDLCVNCGLCKEVCPFHAIIYQPVPCEESCPVGAISKDERGVEHIDPEKCIYCGKCMVACPFGAIFEKTMMIEIFRDMRAGKKVIAMVAPSLGGQFNTEYGKVITAIKKLGFTDVVEVARGANMTTENETKEFIERMEEGAPFMTTSCCPSWMNLVRKHIPDVQKYVSTTYSPMVYTAKYVKEQQPDAITVMVSPCVGKRSEGYFYKEYVDYVLSYEELDALFKATEIDLDSLEPTPLDSTILGHGRGFAMVGGVTKSVQCTAPDPNIIRSLLIDGLDKQSIRRIKQFAKSGECSEGNFIEVMSCPGGCVNGCDTINSPKSAARQIQPTTK